MPGPLITRDELAPRAVSFQARRFGFPNAKAREARVHFTWASAAEVVSMPHGLSAKPDSFTVVASGDSTGASAPKVYAPDPVYWASKNYIALASDTANSWAEVIIR